MRLLLLLVWLIGVSIVVILASTRKGEFKKSCFLVKDIV
jgi:hypothetical protein